MPAGRGRRGGGGGEGGGALAFCELKVWCAGLLQAWGAVGHLGWCVPVGSANEFCVVNEYIPEACIAVAMCCVDWAFTLPRSARGHVCIWSCLGCVCEAKEAAGIGFEGVKPYRKFATVASCWVSISARISGET